MIVKQTLTNSIPVFVGHVYVKFLCSDRQAGLHFIIIQNKAKIDLYLYFVDER